MVLKKETYHTWNRKCESNQMLQYMLHFKGRKRIFHVDGGGGNTILKQLEDAGIDWKEIGTIL